MTPRFLEQGLSKDLDQAGKCILSQCRCSSQKLGSWDFWGIANSVLNKGKSAIPPLFNGPKVLSSASDKVKLFAKTFSRTQILMTQVSIYLFSLRELI